MVVLVIHTTIKVYLAYSVDMLVQALTIDSNIE